MPKQQKYPGITVGSYGEQAIDIVAEAKSISGPHLAARLGVSVYEMSVVRRAVQLGYLKKERLPGQAGTNIYTAGPNMPEQPQKPGKSLPHILLELIARRGTSTSLELAALANITPGEVSSCLSNCAKNGFVKVRSVPSEGKSMRKQVNEFYGANLALYLENGMRGGRRDHVEAAADDEEPQEVPNIVPPRTPPEFRPLNLARLGHLPLREGAWDFRNIPSRFAEEKCA